jgi:hypothetical protein
MTDVSGTVSFPIIRVCSKKVTEVLGTISFPIIRILSDPDDDRNGS